MQRIATDSDMRNALALLTQTANAPAPAVAAEASAAHPTVGDLIAEGGERLRDILDQAVPLAGPAGLRP